MLPFPALHSAVKPRATRQTALVLPTTVPENPHTPKTARPALAKPPNRSQLPLSLSQGAPGMAHKSNPYKKSRAKFRWKWKKKRTRRLQRKRRQMRQRSK